MSLFVCGGAAYYQRRIMHCPVCERRRRFVFAWSWSPYYAPIATCCGCGDSWSDGDRHQRPFKRGWRQEAIASAKERWNAGSAGVPERDDDHYVVRGAA